MAYRLKKDESISAGLRRVVIKESGAAVDQLADAGPSDEAIHDARTSIKKVRAVLQLLRHDVGTQSDWKELRRASHLLSPLRDADAMPNAFIHQLRQQWLSRHDSSSQARRRTRSSRHDLLARQVA